MELIAYVSGCDVLLLTPPSPVENSDFFIRKSGAVGKSTTPT